jgi:hypothetical protein
MSKKYKPVERNAFGPVVCMREPFRGQIMTYDDNQVYSTPAEAEEDASVYDPTCNVRDYIIVYANTIMDGYRVMPRKYFRAATPRDHVDAVLGRMRTEGMFYEYAAQRRILEEVLLYEYSPESTDRHLPKPDDEGRRDATADLKELQARAEAEPDPLLKRELLLLVCMLAFIQVRTHEVTSRYSPESDDMHEKARRNLNEGGS